MKFSMLAVAATALAAGVNGFSTVPATRAFGMRQVSYMRTKMTMNMNVGFAATVRSV